MYNLIWFFIGVAVGYKLKELVVKIYLQKNAPLSLLEKYNDLDD